MFMSVCNTFVYEECVRMMMMVLSRTSLLTAMPHEPGNRAPDAMVTGPGLPEVREDFREASSPMVIILTIYIPI